MAVGAYTTALLLERDEGAAVPARPAARVVVTGAGRRRRRRRRVPPARALPRRRDAGARRRPARPRALLRGGARRRAGPPASARRDAPALGRGRRLLHHRQRPDRRQVPRLPRLVPRAGRAAAAVEPRHEPLRPDVAGRARRRGRRRARRHQPRPRPRARLRRQRRLRRRRRLAAGRSSPGWPAPTSFTIVLSIFLLVAIVVGGLGSLLGARASAARCWSSSCRS